MVPTNAPVVVVVKNQSDIPAFANFTAASATAATTSAPPPAAEPKKVATPPPQAAAPPKAATSSYPKYSSVLLPALSPTMTEGKIAAFHVKVGDKINEGDNIFDV